MTSDKISVAACTSCGSLCSLSYGLQKPKWAKFTKPKIETGVQAGNFIHYSASSEQNEAQTQCNLCTTRTRIYQVQQKFQTNAPSMKLADKPTGSLRVHRETLKSFSWIYWLVWIFIGSCMAFKHLDNIRFHRVVTGSWGASFSQKQYDLISTLSRGGASATAFSSLKAVWGVKRALSLRES